MERTAEQLGQHNVEDLLLPHTLARGFFFYPENRPAGRDKSYSTNGDFWKDVLNDKVIAEHTVVLCGFNLFEWIPRNPGLFHTGEGAWARVAAQEFIRPGTSHVRLQTPMLGPAFFGPNYDETNNPYSTTRTILYTPQGKVSMLQGGVGCVRLGPVELKRGGQAWFMSATSTWAPDEGIPLLMADDIYQTVIEEIRARGSARRDLIGRTKFVPKEFRDLYSHKTGIPRLYLEVVDSRPPDQQPNGEAESGHCEVSVAASFLSEYEGSPRIYAAYVTFNPGKEGARRNAAQWMKQEYVERLYIGSILTDFDQQAPLFADTLFSLDQVLTSPDLAKQIAVLKRKYRDFNWDMLEKSTLSFSTYEENVMVNINASGQGNIINVAKYMMDVSNSINQNVTQSAAPEEVKDLIKTLAMQVSSAGPKIDPALAEKMCKNLEALSKEITAEKPQRSWYEVSLEGLKEAAVAVGELGVPILQTLAKLMPLLLPR